MENPPDNALPSESEQMNRGDIPYYFKFIGDKNLYWLNSLGTYKVETSIGSFQRDIERHAKYENSRWCEVRINSKILITGMLYLLKVWNSSLEINLSNNFYIKGHTVLHEKKEYKF